MLNQKGMMSIETMAKLAAAIMIVTLSLQVVNNIYTKSIQPGSTSIKNQLEQLGRPTVHIGNPKIGKGAAPRAEFRALVAFNMLSAANCQVAGMVIEAQKTREGYNSAIKLKQDALKIFPKFGPLLENTEFKGFCHGASAIDLNPASGLKRLGTANNNRFNDIEGRQGLINVKINSSFTISDEKLARINGLKKINTSPDQLNSVTLKGRVPGFYNGNRIAAFVPAGLTTDIGEIGGDNTDIAVSAKVKRVSGLFEDGKEDENGFSTGWMSTQRQLYYYRIRMVNVPIIIDGGSEFKKDAAVNNDDGPGFTSGDGHFERFVETAKYHFCAGAEGKIQSNAGIRASKYPNYDNSDTVGNGGRGELRGSEAGNQRDGGERADIENGIFTRVELSDHGDCVKTAYAISDGKWGFYDLKAGEKAKTCTFGEFSFNPEADETTLKEINPTGDNPRYVQCGLRKQVTTFPGYDGKVEFYEAGWFGQCEDWDTSTEIVSRFNHLTGGSMNAAGSGVVMVSPKSTPRAPKFTSGSWKIPELQDRDKIILNADFSKSGFKQPVSMELAFTREDQTGRQAAATLNIYPGRISATSRDGGIKSTEFSDTGDLQFNFTLNDARKQVKISNNKIGFEYTTKLETDLEKVDTVSLHLSNNNQIENGGKEKVLIKSVSVVEELKGC